jgi:molybdate transport system substrate-binding protein
MENRAVQRAVSALAIILLTWLAPPAARAERVLVFAAASLNAPLAEIARAHERITGNRVRISFAASSALARQIDRGAPADLYVSANVVWINWLEARGKIVEASKASLAGNRLVMIAPRGSVPAMDSFSAPVVMQILKGQRLAIADPGHVPAGIYARQALAALGTWQQISRHLAPSVNVRAALALVERGAAPLGIVYASDAFNNSAVDVIHRFANTSHTPIQYIAAAIAGNGGRSADAFLSELTGERSKLVFKKYNFSRD